MASTTNEAPGFVEPGRFEVLVTVAAGKLFPALYRDYVEALPLRGNERVLDFGCGAGNPGRFLAARLLAGGGRLTCVDVSRVWLEVARKRLAGNANVEFRLGRLSDLGLADRSYEAAFLHFVLHDVPSVERAEVVSHLARVVTEGGKVFVREPLRFITADEVHRLLGARGFVEESARTAQVPTQGTVYEAVFARSGA